MFKGDMNKKRAKYSAANYLIPICILFDTDKKRATANYLIPNPPSFDGFLNLF